MGKYDFGIDLTNDNTTYTKLIRWTGNGKKVLEIGCHTGAMSKYLKDNGCVITGVEIDPEGCSEARNICHSIIEGNIENEKIFGQLTGTYDVIIFADVLEHLMSPEKILAKIKNLLSSDGYVLISLPNIAHWSVRRNLLMGKFQYQDIGLMDKTHLHFYTFDSFKQLVQEQGYGIDDWEPVSNYNWFDYTFLWARPLYKYQSTRNFMNKFEGRLSPLFPKVIRISICVQNQTQGK
jgi:SAM-dependent methyltransferase